MLRVRDDWRRCCRWLAARNRNRAGTNLREAAVEQRRHFAIARAGRGAAHDDTDQPAPVAHRGGRQIVTRGADIAGFDPIGTIVPVEQGIVVMDDASAKVELPRREIAILPREVAVEGKSQLRLITGRRILIGVRQPGSIAVNRAGHPELPGAARHQLGKGRLAAGQSLGQHRGGIVCRPGDESQNEVLHRDRFAGPETQLCRRPARRLVGDQQILIKVKPAGVQRLEDQI